MPCKCSGYRLEKCKCQLVRSRFPLNPADGQFVILSQNESACFRSRRPAKRGIVLRAAEHFYEKCAGFNLRHCPFRRFPGSDNYFREVLKELFWLLCFLVANLVVFTAIFTRMALHVSLVVAGAARWIRRSISSKMVAVPDTSSDLCYGDRQDQYHNFLPPCYRS